MKLIIPVKIITYLLLQRTHLQSKHGIWIKVLGRIPFNTQPKKVRKFQVEALLRRKAIKRNYLADIQSDWEDIKNHLPESCASIMDIGCGMAGIDIVLYKHYRSQIRKMYLVDRSEIASDLQYLYSNNTNSFYGSLQAALFFLKRNKVSKSNIETVEVDENISDRFKSISNLDLVISLSAWGFHFPVEVYISEVKAALRPKGVLILDIRKDSVGMTILKKHFQEVIPIKEYKKKVRTLVKNPIEVN